MQSAGGRVRWSESAIAWRSLGPRHAGAPPDAERLPGVLIGAHATLAVSGFVTPAVLLLLGLDGEARRLELLRDFLSLAVLKQGDLGEGLTAAQLRNDADRLEPRIGFDRRGDGAGERGVRLG